MKIKAARVICPHESIQLIQISVCEDGTDTRSLRSTVTSDLIAVFPRDDSTARLTMST